jgi:transcriptional regulator with XRE-family HTH domain
MCVCNEQEYKMPAVSERLVSVRNEKSFSEEAAGPFGTIIWRAIQSHVNEGNRLTLEAVAEESGIDYSHFHGIMKGRRGRPIKATSETVASIIEALERLGVKLDAKAAIKAAGIVPEGYALVRDEPDEPHAEPPENWEDWPQELQDALSYTRDMPREVQTFIFQLWRQQAKAHYDIELHRREAERQLKERQRILDEQK